MLKLGELYTDIQHLAAQQHELVGDRAARRAETVRSYREHAQLPAWWSQRVTAADTPLHLCQLPERPGQALPAPPAPDSYCLAATDGSQIYPDRHGAAIWFLINTGQVILRYGESPRAWLHSEPRLFADEREVFRGLLGQRQTVTAEEVAVVRTVEELRALLDLARQLEDRPLLALMDGKLMPWSWADDGFKLSRLEEYAGLLEEFRALGVPVASYVSRTGANEVTNLVRLGDCDQDPPICNNCPHLAALEAELGSRAMTVQEAQALPCGRPAGLVDSDLFSQLLGPGERSALFQEAQVGTSTDRFGERAAFFYLNVDNAEIARVELPEWVARDPGVVDFVHAVLADQNRKGHGYPVALREAHEQAIVRGPDREAFIALLERSLTRHRVTVRHSLKQRAKQVPGV